MVRRVADIKHVGLPNIVTGRRIMPELIQHEATPANVSREAIRFMTDPAARDQAQLDLAEVRVKLGEPGAIRRVAAIVLEEASGRK